MSESEHAAASIDEAPAEILGEESGPIELVFGFVGPTGVDLSKVCESLGAQLKTVGYQTKTVTLSQLIYPYLGRTESFQSEYERIDSLMTEGTNLRRDAKQADIIGRLGLAKIRQLRKDISGSANKPPSVGVAYIVRSFKRPEEVQLFRDVYGKAFTLISVYAPREARRRNLAAKFQATIVDKVRTAEELAVRLIARDFAEDGRLGQQVSSAFPLADFFVTSGTRAQLDANLLRLVRLTFGDQYISPNRDEQGMFFAQASALRSLDLSRQVGAAITTTDGDVLSTGCNEVPKFGGGMYWEGDEGISRDMELGYDSNAHIKRELVKDAFQRMKDEGWLRPALAARSTDELTADALIGDGAFFRDSRLFDVIEFGRAVHAEMAAITQAARLGISVQGAKLYCTTFPCHICARHIVASGIREVVFVEPYEKSRTDQLYGDSISVEPTEPSPKRANFRSFVGVAPRRYMDYFAVTSDRKGKDGNILGANDIASVPRIKRFVRTYLLVEQRMIENTVQLPRQQVIEGGQP
jgi:deoxycytidylate deaminase